MWVSARFKESIVEVKQLVENLKILQAERTLKNHPDSEFSEYRLITGSILSSPEVKWAFSKEAAFYR